MSGNDNNNITESEAPADQKAKKIEHVIFVPKEAIEASATLAGLIASMDNSLVSTNVDGYCLHSDALVGHPELDDALRAVVHLLFMITFHTN